MFARFRKEKEKVKYRQTSKEIIMPVQESSNKGVKAVEG